MYSSRAIIATRIFVGVAIVVFDMSTNPSIECYNNRTSANNITNTTANTISSFSSKMILL